MKFVSVLILVCVFACASAQFGVKGGSSSGVRAGTFFPRLTPSSIQEKKEQLQLANVDDVAGGTSVSGGVVSTGNGFVQPAVQQENGVTFLQERPSQGVLVPSSGSLPSVGSVSVPVAPVSTSVGPQTPVVQTPVQSSFSFVPSFQPVLPAPAVGNVAQVVQPAVQTVQSTVQSVPSVFAPVQAKTVQPSNRYLFDTNFLYDLQQTAQFAPAPAPVPSFPNFAQNIVHFAPQPQVATVQTVPAFASGSFGPFTVGKVGKQFVAPAPAPVSTQAVVSQPAPVQSFPAFSSFPSVSSGFASVPSFPSVQTVQTVPTRFAVPSFSSAAFPVPSTAAVAPVSGKVFSDNKISSPNFSAIQAPLPVISQEKQSAETVQTTEW